MNKFTLVKIWVEGQELSIAIYIDFVQSLVELSIAIETFHQSLDKVYIMTYEYIIGT